MGAVAIVDRTADIAVAAKAIAMSTLLFAGKGPYAQVAFWSMNLWTKSSLNCLSNMHLLLPRMMWRVAVTIPVLIGRKL